jgi:hypothetical protein
MQRVLKKKPKNSFSFKFSEILPYCQKNISKSCSKPDELENSKNQAC